MYISRSRTGRVYVPGLYLRPKVCVVLMVASARDITNGSREIERRVCVCACTCWSGASLTAGVASNSNRSIDFLLGGGTRLVLCY